MPSDRSVKVTLKGDISDFNRAMLAGSASAKTFTQSLDTSTDRMGNLVQSSLALGPALVPIGAAAIPAISGLTNQLAFAAAGAGVAALAFSGIGDALKATNDYALEPSAANFEKMQETLATLGPAGREFVGFLQELRPQLQGLQDAAQEGLFPGVQAGLTDLMDLLPQAERIVSEVAGGLGQVIAEAGDNLNDPRWADFFTFLENEARPTLIDMGRTLGNFAEGFANLWMAFDPLSDNFSKSFLQLSRDFATWTDGLSETEGFQEFVDYINEAGPKAWDALGAIGNALLQIVEAAAPVGQAVLPVITVLADTIASIADSDVGPVLIGAAAGISAISRAVALYNVANGSAMAGLLGKTAFGGAAGAARDLPAASRAYLDFGAALDSTGPKVGKFATTSERLGASLRGAGKIAGGVGGLAFVMSDLDDKMGLSNTAMLGLAGTAFGPWGTAIGAGVGLTMDFAKANDDLWAAVNRANEALSQGPSNLEQQSAAVDEARQKVEDLKEAIDSNTTNSFSGDYWKGFKNFWEGAFGSSDAEESANALSDLEDQLAKNVAEAQEMKFEEAGLSGAMQDASGATRDQTEALLDNIAAHNKLADELLASAGGELAYEQAIDDAHAAAKENGKTLDKTTEKGRANREALYQLAGAWNDLTPAQQNAKGASERAREEFVNAAVQMGANRKAAERMAEKYLEVPSRISTEVALSGAKAAREAAQSVVDALNNISPFKDISVRVRGVTGALATLANLGDTIANLPSVRKADGGLVLGAGTSRSDSIPAMLSNGEFVVNAAATRANLGLLHQINAQKFADGGYVQPARIQRMADGGVASTAPAPEPALDSRVFARAVATATERAMTKSLSGAIFYMAPDGSIQLKNLGA